MARQRAETSSAITRTRRQQAFWQDGDVSDHRSTSEMRFLLVQGSQHRVQLLWMTGSAGPWLALLHEGLGSISQWGSFPTALAYATGRNALVYERRNHGGSDALRSPREHDYHAREAGIFEDMVDQLGIDQIIAYGHSDGATIALLHAAHHPSRVAAVVSEAGHVIAEPVARAGIVEAQRRFATGGLRDALARHHGEHTEAMFRAWSETWLLPEFEGWRIVDDLTTVTAPVLVIQGDADEYATRDHVDWIADAVGGPAERWLLPGVGHAPHREAPAAVIARVAEFLERHGVLGETQERR